MTELSLHHKVVREIKKRFPSLILLAPMGELQNTPLKRIKAWKKGFTAGMPDLLILNSHERWRGMGIEFKRPDGKGVLSEKQKCTHKILKSQGWKIIVSGDFNECISKVEKYFLGCE